MKIACAWLLLVGASSLAFARPVVIEETATLTNPDPAAHPQFGRAVATNGEYALVLGSRFTYEDDTEVRHRAALLYRRVAGQWQFQQVLRSSALGYDGYNFPNLFAMKGNLAVVELDGSTQAYRLDATGWQPAGSLGFITEDIEIDGERIVLSTGDCSYSSVTFEPNESGGWTRAGQSGLHRGCDDEFWGGPVDIDGDRVILGNAGGGYEPEHLNVLIYERATATSWNRAGTIVPPASIGIFQGEVALRGDDVIVDARHGAYVYRYPNLHQEVSRLQPADAYLQSRVRPSRDVQIEKSGDFVFVREPSYDRGGAQVINVFRAKLSAPGTYDHVAVLTPRSGGPLTTSFDVSGNVVIASGAETAYIFELPASLTNRTPRQETFEAGNAANWTTIAGSQFSVVANGANRVYRQSSTAGEARALLNSTNWTNQAIEAEVTPTAFDGNDRWVGLVTRYQNAQNYFYVTLRSSGSVQLKRMRAGSFTTIASTAFPVALNQRYRLRLESIGSVHRVYVNGALLLDADDSGAPHYGNAGLTMNRARADFDNVLVTPSPLTTVFVDDFATAAADPWTHSGTGQWVFNGGAFAQNSVGGEARAVIGGKTADQVVQARVRQIAWSTAGTAERWAGVLARYVDDRNYYYLHLRSGGTVSLRKLVDGTIFTLASAPLAVSLNTQYALRLEVVGNQLRGYVNGNLLLQATDSSHAAGISGLMTNKAATQFDDYVAYQP
ncbi:MAG TPA: hypothetical protein VFU13_05180 [Steroidobacteraceae bacterium]|nr:hypothetical protein [Steroidobacteraceae bacterium]